VRRLLFHVKSSPPHLSQQAPPTNYLPPDTDVYICIATRIRNDCSRPLNEAAYALLQLQSSLSDKCTMPNQSIQKSNFVSFGRDMRTKFPPLLFSVPLLASQNYTVVTNHPHLSRPRCHGPGCESRAGYIQPPMSSIATDACSCRHSLHGPPTLDIMCNTRRFHGNGPAYQAC
jgi:hypothetical protein